jgi:hypothetical protein
MAGKEGRQVGCWRHGEGKAGEERGKTAEVKAEVRVGLRIELGMPRAAA